MTEATERIELIPQPTFSTTFLRLNDEFLGSVSSFPTVSAHT